MSDIISIDVWWLIIHELHSLALTNIAHDCRGLRFTREKDLSMQKQLLTNGELCVSIGGGEQFTHRHYELIDLLIINVRRCWDLHNY